MYSEINEMAWLISLTLAIFTYPIWLLLFFMKVHSVDDSRQSNMASSLGRIVTPIYLCSESALVVLRLQDEEYFDAGVSTLTTAGVMILSIYTFHDDWLKRQWNRFKQSSQAFFESIKSRHVPSPSPA